MNTGTSTTLYHYALTPQKRKENYKKEKYWRTDKNIIRNMEMSKSKYNSAWKRSIFPDTIPLWKNTFNISKYRSYNKIKAHSQKGC